MTILQLKQKAKEIASHTNIGHSQALNLLAKQYGYKSWTALLAATEVKHVGQNW